jgi:uncharacterized damage-inducible protein DinB
MSLASQLVSELQSEAPATRRVLERVPEASLSWKPHVKSMSLGQLALHIAVLPGAIADFVSDPVREVPDVPLPEAARLADVLSAFEQSIASATARLQGWGDEDLNAIWRLTRNGQTIIETPRIGMLRAVMLNHWYHHRGQLTVYLRLLEVPVPPVYGPTADENPFG